MVAAASPNWLGSPQHVAAGATLALALTIVATRWKAPWWLAVTVAVGITCAAEIVLKLAEYVYLVDRSVDAGAYYDFLVDNTSTLAGAPIGAGIGVAAVEYRAHRRQRTRS